MAAQTEPSGGGLHGWVAGAGPWVLVAIGVAFGAVVLFPETHDVWQLNDAAIHGSMTRWAEARIRSGHLPFDGWYPILSLGASRFHHYQSLPHILTGGLSVLLGPATFRWSLYLLLAAWPVSVYGGGRLMGLDRWPASVAALAAPLVVSAPGLGAEWGSYVWRGSGAWAQLWGMWALPFAWGLSWRAVSGRGRLWPAALALGLTVSLHLLVGYLALLSLAVWVLLVPRDALRRIARAAIVAAGALGVAAWTWVPIVVDAGWTTSDEFSRGTFYYDSFGAPKVLGWLVSGGLFDAGRLPTLSVLLALGAIVAAIAAARNESPRAVLGAGLLSMLLFFGRPTLGPVLDLLPGGEDLFLRRYVAGVHLAGLYLIGIGVAWASVLLGRLIGRLRWPAWARSVAVAASVGLLFLPGWLERVGFERQGAEWIAEQHVADATDGADYATLVGLAASRGPGRIFSDVRGGAPTSYKIGQVPAFAALVNLDADQVGFTRPTWSVLSGVEYRFDPRRDSDPPLFGVRYVILPDGQAAPAGFLERGRAGRHVLWEDPSTGYLTVAHTVPGVAADRTNLGARMRSILDSSLPASGMLPTVAFGGRPAADPTLGPDRLASAAPGEVEEEVAAPVDGFFAARVSMDEPGAVVARSSFDPRWRASVDGTEATTIMVAPGMPAVQVPAGTHEIVFEYEPYPWYGILFAAGMVAISAVVLVDRKRTTQF